METRAKKPTKIEDMTKEQIREAILRKRKCNARAQEIVENLLEKSVSSDYLLKSLPDINQSHFEDVVEERSIIHLCGYPLCSNPLSPTDIPKQQYRISVKTNKVYDISVRKKFCSNSCYKSAMHVQNQMLISPLWYREYEIIPDFNLLPLDTVGSLGQEVDLGIVEKVKVKNEPLAAFTSVTDFATANLKQIYPDTDNEGDIQENSTKSIEHNITNPNNNMKVDTEEKNKKTQIENEIAHPDKLPTELKSKLNITKNTNEHKPKQPSKPVSNPMNIVGEIKERPEVKLDPILLQGAQTSQASPKKVALKKPPAVAVLSVEVEKCLAEWFTLDTLLFLLGEVKVREMVTNKGEHIKQYLNNYAKGIFYNSNTYDQYQLLCKKLNMLELDDKKFYAQTLKKETKPLPDYSIIKEESKRMQLKVKAFLAGEIEIPETSGIEENMEVDEESPLTQLPLVDSNAQNALRRRIVCQHLNKVLPDLLRSLGLLTLSISSDVRLLVNTFKLQANNIMFKPLQWTLIAIVIIKLLSLRDSRLAYLLDQPMAFKHMQLLLLSYKQEGGYLERLISWLTDVDRLLDTNDIQLTVT